jgi:uncharacterized membrane protein YtjA (UPF0391 family)
LEVWDRAEHAGLDSPGPSATATSQQATRTIMLTWAIIFLIISVIAGVFGFSGISAATAGIAKILFFIFIVIFIIIVIAGFVTGSLIL